MRKEGTIRLRSKLLWVFVLTACVAACGGPSSSEARIATGIALTEQHEYLIELSGTATALAMATDTLTPTQRPTKTPTPDLPDYCYENANHYLDEVDEIIDGIFDSIGIWNNSARFEQQLLEHELRLRPLVERAEQLSPPSDFMEMHEHFLVYVRGTLNATLGIIDESDERLEGSNVTYLNEFDLAIEAWDEAINNRERTCD